MRKARSSCTGFSEVAASLHAHSMSTAGDVNNWDRQVGTCPICPQAQAASVSEKSYQNEVAGTGRLDRTHCFLLYCCAGGNVLVSGRGKEGRKNHRAGLPFCFAELSFISAQQYCISNKIKIVCR